MIGFVYCIEHTSGHRYIGASATSFLRRWGKHLQLLELGTHHSSRFQKKYNEGCNVTEWTFHVLFMGEVSSRRELTRIEADHIVEVPTELRLNMPNHTTTTREKHAQVTALLKQGKRYIDIRDEVGMSIGMISNIKKTITEGSSKFYL